MGVALTALSRVTSAACGVPGTWLLVFSPGDGHGPVEVVARFSCLEVAPDR
jgi:hypothetical protein